MRFLSLSLQDFRNLPLLRWNCENEALFLLGSNGAGKTNLLEALALVTALRSFRTTRLATLRRWNSRETRLVYHIQTSLSGPREVEMRLQAACKQVFLDGERLPRLADLFGLFPTVPMSAQDIQLLRGSPPPRRRFFDLLFAACDKSFYSALSAYTRALAQRNALLKQKAPDQALSPWEQILASAAATLVPLRARGVQQLSEHFLQVYALFAPENEPPRLTYLPSGIDHPDTNSSAPGDGTTPMPDAEAWRALFQTRRPKDRAYQTTTLGPHRDDYQLRLHGRDARLYASEGQQRSLVLALALAKARFFENALGEAPVILADDILNELDDRRRALFWSTVPAHWQVIATGTRLPIACPRSAWCVSRIADGQLLPNEPNQITGNTANPLPKTTGENPTTQENNS